VDGAINMGVNLDGVFHLVLMGLTEHVFGNIVIASTMLMLVIVVLALLIQIPVPFAVAIPIPLVIVLTAYGYLTIVTGGVLTSIFLVLAIASFLGGLGISR
jgi:hypothetical protein